MTHAPFDDHLPPISYMDPDYESADDPRPGRFALAGFLTVLMVAALLIAALMLGGAQ